MTTSGYAKTATSLFFTGLPEEVSEPDLIRHIERFDRTIKYRTINVLRNYQTMRSRGLAIVEFATPEDAEKALKLLNYTDLLGKEMHAMWYRPGGIKDRITGNVFVKNLPADFKSHDLYELFLSFGKIFSCRVKYDGAGRCKGYGYVQFETKESADKALAEGGQKVVKDAKIEVCPFKQRESRNSSITMYNNLFVKCIPKKFTNDDLNKMFSPFGEIVSAVVIKDRNESTENRGFGFVCFKKNEDAKTAEEKLKNFQIEGQTLYVCRALPLEEHRRKMREDRLKTFKDCNLYVKPLPEDIDDQGLKKAFEAFGRVLSARVMVERVQDQAAGKVQVKSKGFGFVCLSTKEEAKNAMMAAANGQQILGRTMYVGIAEKKEERMAKFAQGMFPPMYGMPPPMFHGQPPRHRRPYEGRPRHMGRPYMPGPDQMYPYMMPMMRPPMAMPMQMQMPMGMPPMGAMPYPQPVPVAGQAPTPSEVVPLPHDKEQLGEYLYPMVESKDKQNAAKITGMLLEMEIEQIHNIIKDPAQLDKWISEALKVLNTSPPAA